MKKLMIGLFLLFVSLPAMAQQGYPRDITLTFRWPTTYVSGELIQEGDLRGGDAICFRNQELAPTFDLRMDIGVPLGSLESILFAGVIPRPGNYRCFVTAVTVDEISSDLSDEARRRFTGKPMAMVEFTAD